MYGPHRYRKIRQLTRTISRRPTVLSSTSRIRSTLVILPVLGVAQTTRTRFKYLAGKGRRTTKRNSQKRHSTTVNVSITASASHRTDDTQYEYRVDRQTCFHDVEYRIQIENDRAPCHSHVCAFTRTIHCLSAQLITLPSSACVITSSGTAFRTSRL